MSDSRLVPSARRPGSHVLAYSGDREEALMASAMPSHYPRRENVRFYLVYGVTYPLFLAAESLQRRMANESPEGASAANTRRSVFAAAHESTSIAISYVLTARMKLQAFARQHRSERLS